MARKIFKGVFVPNVTPFKNGKIDEGGLKAVVNYLIENGATGLVPMGTTGESATLSHEEHRKVLSLVIDEVNGRVPVIAGAGSNCTAEAVPLTKYAEDAGADAILSIGPYYNKPTQQGIIEHFKAIAKSVKIPVLIYNIPGRTARNIEVSTIIELSKVNNIVGVKEASGDINQVMAVINGTKEFSVLSGEDHLTFTVCCLGGQGAISAAAHILPKEWVKMCKLIEEGKIAQAREIHYKLLPITRALFFETNPSPVKTALKLMGVIETDEVRLPLVPSTEKCTELLKTELKKLNLLK